MHRPARQLPAHLPLPASPPIAYLSTVAHSPRLISDAPGRLQATWLAMVQDYGCGGKHCTASATDRSGSQRGMKRAVVFERGTRAGRVQCLARSRLVIRRRVLPPINSYPLFPCSPGCPRSQRAQEDRIPIPLHTGSRSRALELSSSDGTMAWHVHWPLATRPGSQTRQKSCTHFRRTKPSSSVPSSLPSSHPQRSRILHLLRTVALGVAQISLSPFPSSPQARDTHLRIRLHPAFRVPCRFHFPPSVTPPPSCELSSAAFPNALLLAVTPSPLPRRHRTRRAPPVCLSTGR